MTTSRILTWVAVWVGASGLLFAQTPGQNSPSSTAPTEVTWAAAEFSGSGEWVARFPLLISRDWKDLTTHVLSESEVRAWQKTTLENNLRALDQKESSLALELDRKRLIGTLSAADVSNAEKSRTDWSKQREGLMAPVREPGPPADPIPLKPTAASGGSSLWTGRTGPEVALRSKATYVLLGEVRMVGPALLVKAELYSSLDKRVLTQWIGQFSPDEASEKAAEASDRFRSFLLGRPWAGVSVTSPTPGTRVRWKETWYPLPWTSDQFEPGPLSLGVRFPGHPEEVRTYDLQPEQRTELILEAPVTSVGTLRLETEPPGAFLYQDSRYLGPSPQTIERPLVTHRIRAEAPGWADLAWEVGPQSPEVVFKTLHPPTTPPSVPDAKDRFYVALAAFSFSLTSTTFLGAWWDDRAKLMVYYADRRQDYYANYRKAYDNYWWTGAAYAGGIVLTSGVFVWMMFELADYLGIAEASLP